MIEKLKNIPEKIYLQIGYTDEEHPPIIDEDVTWCADKIMDNDIEYIRADVARAGEAEWRKFADDIMSGNFGYMEPEARYAELLKKYGGTE